MKTPGKYYLTKLLQGLKPCIMDDYRAEGWEDCRFPSMDITIGWSPDSGDWDYQTGDNSFTGNAYGFPVWAVVTLTRRANCKALAGDLIDQLLEQTAY